MRRIQTSRLSLSKNNNKKECDSVKSTLFFRILSKMSNHMAYIIIDQFSIIQEGEKYYKYNNQTTQIHL
jgi:hypothetical protein